MSSKPTSKELHDLLMLALEITEGITMVGARGTEISIHRKLEILIDVRADVIKKWVLGASQPSGESLRKLLDFVKNHKE